MRRLGYILSGSGTQYPGMGAALYEESGTFRTVIDECADAISPWICTDLRSVMFQAGADLLASHPYMSCANFALQCALHAHLASEGLKPVAILAHSLGGHAAAYAAGAVDLREACQLLHIRCRVLSTLQEPGAMAVIEEGPDIVKTIVAQGDYDVEIVSVNGPAWTTLAGGRPHIERLVAEVVASGRKARVHRISHAFHSKWMEPALDLYASALSGRESQAPTIPVYTTVSPDPIISFDTAFWLRQLRGTMNFADAYMAYARHVDTSLEVGPGGGFARFVRQIDGPTASVHYCLSQEDAGHTRATLSRLRVPASARGALAF